MAESSVTYYWPAWGMIPPVKHSAKAVHVQVKFDEDSTLPVEIKHNFALPYGAPLQPPEFIYPIVLVNATVAGINAPLHVLGFLDGDTITLARAAGGPGTNVTYDMWIYRPHKNGLFADW